MPGKDGFPTFEEMMREDGAPMGRIVYQSDRTLEIKVGEGGIESIKLLALGPLVVVSVKPENGMEYWIPINRVCEIHV